MTIARNLGFPPCGCIIGSDGKPEKDEKGQLKRDNRLDKWDTRGIWRAGETEVFHFTKEGFTLPLFDVRAFKNGNLHLRFNQSFILALNVEHGRLKGWLHTPEEAAEELKDPAAAAYFKTNCQLLTDNPARLLAA